MAGFAREGARTAVWLDCDPGHDDAMAIILAGHSPRVNLLGVSTTCGNQTVDKTTDNALRILHLIGRDDVEVYRGASKPLMRARRNCPEIHGASGLDGPDIPAAPRGASNQKAVIAMAKAISEFSKEEDKVVVVATGALTNIAMLLSLYPELTDDIEVVLMGGAMGKGNTGPVAEFNIQCDPEAAHIVFESGVELTMVPLEVTHKALVTPEVRALIKGGAGAGAPGTTRFRRLVDEMLQFFAETYKEVFAFEHPPLHDPCAVAYVLAPHIFRALELRVDIEKSSELSAGQTVCDVWGQSGKPANCRVATKMDVSAFWKIMCDAIDAADRQCPIN